MNATETAWSWSARDEAGRSEHVTNVTEKISKQLVLLDDQGNQFKWMPSIFFLIFTIYKLVYKE